jgi:hypothetical protein
MGGDGTILHIIHKKTVYCDRSNLDGLLSVWAACCPAKKWPLFGLRSDHATSYHDICHCRKYPLSALTNEIGAVYMLLLFQPLERSWRHYFNCKLSG